MIQMQWMIVVWLSLSVLAAGCSGTYSTRDENSNAGSSGVYMITLEDALLVMQDAMEKEFPDERIEDVLSPHRGYKAKIRFLLDVDVISVYAVPARGRAADGTMVNGYSFETYHSGTYPLGGIPKAKALLERVVAGADRLSSAIPRLPASSA